MRTRIKAISYFFHIYCLCIQQGSYTDRWYDDKFHHHISSKGKVLHILDRMYQVHILKIDLNIIFAHLLQQNYSGTRNIKYYSQKYFKLNILNFVIVQYIFLYIYASGKRFLAKVWINHTFRLIFVSNSMRKLHESSFSKEMWN